MNTENGQIRYLAEGEQPKEGEIRLSEDMAQALQALPEAKRMEVYRRMTMTRRQRRALERKEKKNGSRKA